MKNLDTGQKQNFFNSASCNGLCCLDFDDLSFIREVMLDGVVYCHLEQWGMVGLL